MLLHGRGNCTHCSFLKAEHQVSCWKSWVSATHLWVISVESKVFLFCLLLGFPTDQLPSEYCNQPNIHQKVRTCVVRREKEHQLPSGRENWCQFMVCFQRAWQTSCWNWWHWLYWVQLQHETQSTLQHLMMASYTTALETRSACLPAPCQSRLACVSLFAKALVD